MPRKKETRGRKKKYKTERQRREAMKKCKNDSNKRRTTTFTLRLLNTRDKEVIDKIKSIDKKTDYIRRLVKEDLRNDKQ